MTNVQTKLSLHDSYLKFIEKNCKRLHNLEQLTDDEQVTEAIELLFEGNIEKLKKTLLSAEKSKKLQGLKEVAIILYICQRKFIKDQTKNNPERLAKARLFRQLHYARKF